MDIFALFLICGAVTFFLWFAEKRSNPSRRSHANGAVKTGVWFFIFLGATLGLLVSVLFSAGTLVPENQPPMPSIPYRLAGYQGDDAVMW